MIDIVSVPHVLKDAVSEPEHQDVLHRLFAEVVVDAEDLVFAEHLVHLVVQRLGRLQIMTERLLDNDADPIFTVATICWSGHAMFA